VVSRRVQPELFGAQVVNAPSVAVLEKGMSISVVMAVYNGAAYLGEAIESVLRQTYTDFEFVVVDDGSVDETPAIIKHYSDSDSRVVPLRLPSNQGMSAALNAGIAAAKGDLIARFDSDDIMIENRLERQLAYLSEHPEISVAASYSYLINDRGRLIGKSMPVVDIDRAKRTHNPSLFLEIVHPTVMMRKADFIAVGGYRDFSPVEDRDLWSRFATNGYRIGIQPEFLLLNRRHSNNISLTQHQRGSRLAGLVNHNTIRRWRGEADQSLDEYLSSFNAIARLNDKRQVLALFYYRKAVLAFSSRSLWSVFRLMSLACLLEPKLILRVKRRLVMG
jgi:glycosyltransferase involved in cell wall biosynthesis